MNKTFWGILAGVVTFLAASAAVIYFLKKKHICLGDICGCCDDECDCCCDDECDCDDDCCCNDENCECEKADDAEEDGKDE